MKAPKQDYTQSLENIDEDEKLLAVIKRHPFGIIKLYVEVIVGLGGAAVLIAFLLPSLLEVEDASSIHALIGIVSVGLIALMVIILMIATVIYYESKLVVTTKTITQTLQLSLFHKKTSQLAVSNIEDVTANRNGFFPTILNYGKLLVETAGEQENFHFDYCAHPDHYAKLILEARQQFISENGGDTYREQVVRNNAK